MANNIPSELQNRIYDFCVEPEPICEGTFELDACPTIIKYMGLTQACRQLRSEFRTKYMAATTFRFEWPNCFTAYAARFYPEQDSSTVQGYCGNISFNMTSSDTETLDILPMLQFLTVAPHVRLNFEFHLYKTHPYRKNPALTQINGLFNYTAEQPSKLWYGILRNDMRWIEAGLGPRPELSFTTLKKTAYQAEKRWAEAGLPEMSFFDQKFCWYEGGHGRREGSVTFKAFEPIRSWFPEAPS